ncbi:MAG TPA: outer membrane beta-barrel protein [Flavisolibacter sp.]|nr:outer membrane beta-barrel protein [Flavisolibacter sp.]
MKKVFLAFAIVVASFAANAQTGKNQLGIGVEVGLPMGDFGDAFGVGIGGTAKYMHGIGSAGQLTLTSGYQRFGAKDLPSGFDASASIIPILAGYRHNFSGLFIEPQLGYGIYGAKASGSGMNISDSEGAFTYAIGAGYAMAQGLDLGVRYQSGSKDGESTSFIGFRVGWNFSLGGSK